MPTRYWLKAPVQAGRTTKNILSILGSRLGSFIIMPILGSAQVYGNWAPRLFKMNPYSVKLDWTIERWRPRISELELNIAHRAGFKTQASDTFLQLEICGTATTDLDNDLPEMMATLLDQGGKNIHCHHVANSSLLYTLQRCDYLVECVNSMLPEAATNTNAMTKHTEMKDTPTWKSFCKHKLHRVKATTLHGCQKFCIYMHVLSQRCLVRKGEVDGALPKFSSSALQAYIQYLLHYWTLHGNPRETYVKCNGTFIPSSCPWRKTYM